MNLFGNNPDNVFENALTTLNTTVSSITGKVEQQKERVAKYKQELISKLLDISNALIYLKQNTKTKSGLKEQVKSLKQDLTKATAELTKKKEELNTCKPALETLQTQMQNLVTKIEEKDRQIKELNTASRDKDTTLSKLQNDKSELLNEKQEIDNKLTKTSNQLTELTNDIGKINNTLGQNVSEIDTIMDGLDKAPSNEDIDTHFEIMRTNIEQITKMINGSNSNNDNEPNNRVHPRYTQNFVNRPNPLLSPIPLQSRPRPNNPTGGKRKTHKRRYKRTYKRTLKGGYVYNSSSKLDKASAVILTSSKDKSFKKKSKRQKT